MLEIFLVVHLCHKLGELCRSRGRTAGWFQLLLVLAWIGGEIFAAILGAIVYFVIDGANAANFEPPMAVLYLSGLVGAGLGAWSIFLLVRMLPNLKDDELAADRICTGCGEPLRIRDQSCPLCGKQVMADV